MKRAAWLTDIHLNFLSPVQFEKLFSLVRNEAPDSILISGDIGEAPRLIWYLKQLESRFQRPIYFVLGNHDYYFSSLGEVQQVVSELVKDSQWLYWMNQAGIVELASGVGMIGHDSWADGRCGDYAHSDVMLTDYVVIRDFVPLGKDDRLRALNQLGDEAAAYVREWLPKALAMYRRVFFLTHVPPFLEACWHQGQLSDDSYLPHFACKAVGEALVEIMRQHPQHELTVLCGHTHGRGEVRMLDNLRVLTGGAEYGRAEVQQVFELGV